MPRRKFGSDDVSTTTSIDRVGKTKRRQIFVESTSLLRPSSLDDCKNLLMTRHADFVERKLLNRHGRIDSASVRIFASSTRDDMFEKYLQVLQRLEPRRTFTYGQFL